MCDYSILVVRFITLTLMFISLLGVFIQEIYFLFSILDFGYSLDLLLLTACRLTALLP